MNKKLPNQGWRKRPFYSHKALSVLVVDTLTTHGERKSNLFQLPNTHVLDFIKMNYIKMNML